jgi:hypothetical protein
MVRYLRLLAFSVVSLGLAACVRLAPMVGLPSRAEPRIGEPSAAGEVTEQDRVLALEGQVEALNAELAALRKALVVMGPLPEPSDFFIPVASADIAGDIPTTDAETEASARLARLYAPPPSFASARSLFYEAELGSCRARGAAEAGWNRLAGDKRLAGLHARYSTDGGNIRLVAGPPVGAAAVTSLSVELSALAGQCRVAAPMRAY